MTYADSTALCHGNTEYVSEHHDINAVCPGSERLVTDHIDKIRYYHLTQAV